MNQINFKFISDLEGGQKLEGYVPHSDGSQSGVTIATGFDLGCRKFKDLKYLYLPLQAKLRPYCGAKNVLAKTMLKKYPLIITQEEADLIDKITKKDAAKSLEEQFNAVSKEQFCELPEQAQTVIMSVGFQYGNLAIKCPKFWDYAVNTQWHFMIEELQNFKDKYPTRRGKEADYLKTLFEGNA